MDHSSQADAEKKKKNPVALLYSWFQSEGDKVPASCSGTIYINDFVFQENPQLSIFTHCIVMLRQMVFFVWMFPPSPGGT